MIGQQISHYKILEELGRGGMGVVYKAEDTKLKRTVALKFLALDLTRDPEIRKRFIHEAQAASALEHPNICNIHEIEETENGQIFICMAYYKGETLKDKIARGPLPLSEAIDCAIQIIQGLHHAHTKGIVHRDVKPANILITEEETRVKIVDFGLAKLVGQTKLTRTGMTMGTMAYMSPEQTEGQEVDHRSDIFSFGVVLYEMLTGQHPFKGDYEQAVIYSILHEEPEPITGLRTGVPMELEHIVNKTLSKISDERYQHSDEILTDLRRAYHTLTGKAPRPVNAEAKDRWRRWAVSPVVWLIFIIFFGLMGGVLIFYPTQTIPFSERDWILIADFENLTGDDVFDRSLNAALMVSIQQSSYVNVFPRTRIHDTLRRMQKEKAATLNQELGGEIALREGVKALVVPTISLIGDVYSLSARIVSPSTQVDLKTVSSQAKDKNEILQALDELARNLRRDLGESLTSISQQSLPLPKATTTSLEALKSFAEGRQLRGTDDRAGINLIREAVELDSNFALAHADLGVHYYITNDRPRGEEHFKKALSLINRLSTRERLWIRAVAEDWRGNREQAIDSYRTYLTQYPDDEPGWFRLGYVYMITDRLQLAVDAFTRVLEINPSAAGAQVNIATSYNAMRKNDEAAAHYLRAFEMSPKMITAPYVNHEYGNLRLRMGEIEKAVATFEKMLSVEENSKKARGHRSLALLNMYLGKYSLAINHLKEAILLNKTSGALLSQMRDHLYLATVSRGKGMNNEFAAAMSTVKRIQTEVKLSPFWLQLIGKIYARTGNIGEADLLLSDVSARINDPVASSSVARSNRRDQAAYNLLKGEIELARESYNEAVELFEIAQKIQEGSYFLESLAHGYFMRGDFDEALNKYQELIARKELGSESQEYWILAHYQLGRIYEQKGVVDQAVEYYKQFLEIWKDADEDLVDLIEAKKKLAKLRTVSIN